MAGGDLHVVSLLPSATDTVCALDAQDRLVGRSHECDDPTVAHVTVCTSSKVEGANVEDLSSIMAACNSAVSEACFLSSDQSIYLLEYGLGVYRIDLHLLTELKPDVILTQLQGENGGNHEAFQLALDCVLGYCPTIVHLDASNLEGVCSDIQKVAASLQLPEQGEKVAQGLRKRLSVASDCSKGRPKQRVMFLQWLEPLFTGSAWVPQMINMLGADDIAGTVDEALQISPDSIKDGQPDLLLFSLCGMGLEEGCQRVTQYLRKFRSTFKDLPVFRNRKIAVMDGQRLFSRPGPLLAESMESLLEVLHPEALDYGYQGRNWKFVDFSTV